MLFDQSQSHNSTELGIGRTDTRFGTFTLDDTDVARLNKTAESFNICFCCVLWHQYEIQEHEGASLVH